MVICLERGADLHTVRLMPLPLTVSCFSKIQIGFTFLVPAHLGSPGHRAIKRMCVYVQDVAKIKLYSYGTKLHRCRPIYNHTVFHNHLIAVYGRSENRIFCQEFHLSDGGKNQLA